MRTKIVVEDGLHHKIAPLAIGPSLSVPFNKHLEVSWVSGWLGQNGAPGGDDGNASRSLWWLRQYLTNSKETGERQDLSFSGSEL